MASKIMEPASVSIYEGYSIGPTSLRLEMSGMGCRSSGRGWIWTLGLVLLKEGLNRGITIRHLRKDDHPL